MRLTAIKTTHPHYPFVEELFLAAFPESERRPVEAQRLNVDGNARFRCYLLTEDDDAQGIRNGGFGSTGN